MTRKSAWLERNVLLCQDLRNTRYESYPVVKPVLPCTGWFNDQIFKDNNVAIRFVKY